MYIKKEQYYLIESKLLCEVIGTKKNVIEVIESACYGIEECNIALLKKSKGILKENL